MNTACYKQETSRAHQIAVEKYNNYGECDKSSHDTIIHNQLVNTEGRQSELIQRNWEHIKVIIDIVLTPYILNKL